MVRGHVAVRSTTKMCLYAFVFQGCLRVHSFGFVAHGQVQSAVDPVRIQLQILLQYLDGLVVAPGLIKKSSQIAALGDKDEAFACLEKAYEKHDFFLVFLKVHPYKDPLRSDARYAELVHRIGLS